MSSLSPKVPIFSDHQPQPGFIAGLHKCDVSGGTDGGKWFITWRRFSSKVYLSKLLFFQRPTTSRRKSGFISGLNKCAVSGGTGGSKLIYYCVVFCQIRCFPSGGRLRYLALRALANRRRRANTTSTSSAKANTSMDRHSFLGSQVWTLMYLVCYYCAGLWNGWSGFFRAKPVHLRICTCFERVLYCHNDVRLQWLLIVSQIPSPLFNPPVARTKQWVVFLCRLIYK